MSFVSVKDVYKRYKMGEITINASDGISFDIEKGELAIVLGPSGSGKTTVLNMLGGMDTIDEGSIMVDGKDIAKYSTKELISGRRYEIGFIFQNSQLLKKMDAMKNVELPLIYQGIGPMKRKVMAQEALERIKADGAARVFVQPTLLIPGEE